MNIIYCWKGTEFRESALFQLLVFIEVNTEKCFSCKQKTGMKIWLQLSNSRSDTFELPCCVWTPMEFATHHILIHYQKLFVRINHLTSHVGPPSSWLKANWKPSEMQKDLLCSHQGHSLSQPYTITSHCAFGIQSFTNNTLAGFEMHVKYYLTFVIGRRDNCEERNALALKQFLGHVHLRRENTQQLRSKRFSPFLFFWDMILIQ